MEALFVVFGGLLMLGATNAAANVYLQRELTVRIEPGKIDCFFAKAFDKQVIDIEYQVIDGGHGDLDISFELLNPTGYPHISEYKKPENIHRVKTNMDGDYKFCFDNTFSTFNSKLVFFEIIIEWEDENKQQNEDDWGSDVLNNLTADQLVDEKFDDLHRIVMHLHVNLNRMKHDLDIRRSSEARDRNLSERNNSYVGFWSMFQIVVMVIVGAVQVFMLRSLFETDPRHNIWKRYSLLK